MEDKCAPQEGPRDGAPASPGAGPNSPLQAANKHGAPPKAEAPQNSPTGPACKAQVDLPNDDDLANWSHHASVATTGDEVLKSAMAGSALVSFVFGMEVTADLVRAHAAS